jgi:alpha-L-fucosidase
MEIYTTAPQLGDYGTPEYSFGEAKTTQKWEVCRSISPAFGYNWQDDDASSLSSKELVRLFIKIVSGNGNLLLVISPDASGRLPDIQKDRMLDLGKYLKVNGEAIYGTRPWERTHEGENMYFTRSKDGKYLYVHCTEWTGSTVKINGVTPAKGSKVTMLGSTAPLKWENVEGGVKVVSASNFDAVRNRTSDHAVVFKVQLK